MEIKLKDQKQAGIILSYAFIFVNILITLIYTPFLLRNLGQSDYGLYSIAYSVFSLSMILELGFGNANIRYTARYISENRDQSNLHGMFFILYSIIGFFSLIISAIIIFNTNSLFGNSLDEEQLKKLSIMLVLVLISISVIFPFQIFQYVIIGYERFVFNNITRYLKALLVPFFSVFLLIAGYGSLSLIALISTLNIIFPFIHFLYCRKKLNIKLSFKFDKSLFREIFSYSFFVFLGAMAFHLNNNANQFILGSVSGAETAAIYSLGFNLVLNFQMLSISVSGVFLPAISKIPNTQNKTSEYNNYFIAIGRIQFYIISLFLIGFIFVGKQFIVLWVGIEYIKSFEVCLIALLALTVYMIQTSGISILQAQKKHRFSSIILVVGAFVNIISSIILSKYFGALGAAISIAVVWFLGHGLILNWYYYKKIELNIKRFWLQMLKITPSFIIPVVFIAFYKYFFVINSWLSLGFAIAGFTLFYLLSIILFSFNEFEKSIFLTPIKQKISGIYNQTKSKTYNGNK